MGPTGVSRRVFHALPATDIRKPNIASKPYPDPSSDLFIKMQNTVDHKFSPSLSTEEVSSCLDQVGLVSSRVACSLSCMQSAQLRIYLDSTSFCKHVSVLWVLLDLDERRSLYLFISIYIQGGGEILLLAIWHCKKNTNWKKNIYFPFRIFLSKLMQMIPWFESIMGIIFYVYMTRIIYIYI